MYANFLTLVEENKFRVMLNGILGALIKYIKNGN
jgi:hypothetical protein